MSGWSQPWDRRGLSAAHAQALTALLDRFDPGEVVTFAAERGRPTTFSLKITEFPRAAVDRHLSNPEPDHGQVPFPASRPGEARS